MGPASVAFLWFVNFFSKFGRYADLICGIVLVALGVRWFSHDMSWGPFLTIVGGTFSLCAFWFDLNGRVQRSAQKYARSRLVVKRR